MFQRVREDALQIQMLIALLMKCLQATVEFSDAEEPASDNKTTESGPTDVHAKAFGSAFYWTNYFWKDLLSRWPKVKAAENERQIRAVINNALVDALACRNLPEWPVANLLVLNLAGNLLERRVYSVKIPKSERWRSIFSDKRRRVCAKTQKLWKKTLFGDNSPERMTWISLPIRTRFLSTRRVVRTSGTPRVQTRVDAQDANAIVANEEAREEIFALESILARYVAENNRSVASAAADTMDETEEDGGGDDENPSTVSKRHPSRA